MLDFHEDERKLQTTEMRMLCTICSKTLKDGISDKTNCNKIGVEKIEEFLREQWYGHMERMDKQRVPVKAKNFVVDCLKKGSRKKRMKEVAEKHMLFPGFKTLKGTDARNRFVLKLCCKIRLILACGKSRASGG